MAQFPSQSAASGLWSLKKQKRAQQGLNWPTLFGPADDYFEYVTMLLPGNGTNGAQNNTFLDSSTNNFTITRNGNTTQGTFSPYGSNWSNVGVPNGSNSITTTYPGLTGAGDYTVSFWIYLNSWTGGDNNGSDGGFVYIYGQGASHPTYPFAVRITKAGKVIVVDSVNFGPTWESTFDYAGSYNTANSIKLNTWNYIHIVRNSGTLSIYANGNLQLSVSQSSAMAASVTNGTINDGNGFDGYISNFRIATTAITNATPPTAPSSATGAVLLTCASNRFQDLTGTYTVTPAGSASVQRFSPFNPTAPYAAGTDGGSGYFDASGDYLAIASGSTAVAIGTGDFTIECWYYPAAAVSSDVATLFSSTQSDSGSTIGLNLNVFDDRKVYIRGSFPTSNTVTVGAWNHIVASRVSGTTRIFINGVLGSSNSDSNNYVTNGCFIGARNIGSIYAVVNGYICDMKVTRGSGVTSVTVPTTPATNSGSPAVLCNFTNAGIIDNAEMNNLETVGNAQISTAQSKFGGASMYFDGNGDYCLGPTSPSFEFGSGDFTIEAWLYRTADSGQYDSEIVGYGNPNTLNGWHFGLSGSSGGTANRIQLNLNYSGYLVISSGTIPVNTWTHVAVTRSGTSFKVFINGNQDGSATSSATPTTTSSSRLYVGTGAYDPGSVNRTITGNIDDLRITKGYARYTANFTAPTAPFPLY